MTYTDSKTDLVINKLTLAQYNQLLLNNQVKDNELYAIEQDNLDANNERLINVADPVELSDAVNKHYLNAVSADIIKQTNSIAAATIAAIPLSTSLLTNDSNFLTSIPVATDSTLGGILTGYTENGNNYAVKLSNNKAYVSVPWVDSVVSNAVYVPATNEIVISFKTNGSASITPISVNVADLVDTYTAGNGIKIENNRISISADYYNKNDITLNSNGQLKVDNTTITALTAHLSLTNYYTKSEVSSATEVNTAFVHLSGDSNIGPLQLSGNLNVGNNTIISKSANAIGTNNIVGQKAWYYSAIDFTNKIVYLTDNISNRINGSTTLNSSFQSGFAVGDIISFVNDSKYDRKSKVTAVNGNKITVDSLPFDSIVTGKSDYDDYVIFSNNKPAFGCVDLGGSAFADGTTNKAFGNGSHASGYKTEAYGNYSFTEGRETSASYCAHAEGRYNNATGQNSHAEGNNNSALGYSSHAEGIYTTASGEQGSHSEGHGTESSGSRGSHAEGKDTKAQGDDGSHAEGNGTTASGTNGSHAEGRDSQATGNDGSHAEGYGTTAAGSSSHAEGRGTITSKAAEHAEGNYNKSNTTTLHSVGIGTSDIDRKNSFEIMLNGDVYILNIGGYDGTNATASTTKTILNVFSTLANTNDSSTVSLRVWTI